MKRPISAEQMNRIQKLRKITATRQKLSKDQPIFLRKGGEITSAGVIRVSQRWNKRKGHTVMSYDEPIRGIKSPVVALRLVSKQILRATDKTTVSPKAKAIVKQLAEHRDLMIPGTRIRANNGIDLLMLKLVNQVGEKKALQIVRLMQKSALKARKHLTKKGVSEKTGRSDAFGNMPLTYSVLASELELDMRTKTELSSRIKELIEERKKDLERIKTMDIINKQMHIHNMRAEIRDAIVELTKFKFDHDLPY